MFLLSGTVFPIMYVYTVKQNTASQRSHLYKPSELPCLQSSFLSDSLNFRSRIRIYAFIGVKEVLWVSLIKRRSCVVFSLLHLELTLKVFLLQGKACCRHVWDHCGYSGVWKHHYSALNEFCCFNDSAIVKSTFYFLFWCVHSWDFLVPFFCFVTGLELSFYTKY